MYIPLFSIEGRENLNYLLSLPGLTSPQCPHYTNVLTTWQKLSDSVNAPTQRPGEVVRSIHADVDVCNVRNSRNYIEQIAVL